MKNIKQIRENFDLITEKEEKEDRKLSALVRAGLYDAKKLPALKKALDKSADKMTAQEKRMLLNLLDSLISQVTSDEQVYRKVRQNVHSMNEARRDDTYSKFDSRVNQGYPSDKDVPTVLILKRKAIRVYPDNQKVALYYSQALDKYVTIPFSDIQVGLNESTKNQTPDFKLKAKTGSAFNQEKEKEKDDEDDNDEKDSFKSVGARISHLNKKGLNVGGIAGTLVHDAIRGKFRSEPEDSKTSAPSEAPAATKPAASAKSNKPKRTYRARKATKATTGPAKVKSQAATRAAAAAIQKKNPKVQFSQAAMKRMSESFDQKLQMIREAVLNRSEREGTEGARIPRGGGFNPAQIPYGGINPRRQGSGELSRGRVMSGSLRRGTTLKNPFARSPVKTMRSVTQDVRSDITRKKDELRAVSFWKKQAAKKTSSDNIAAKPTKVEPRQDRPPAGSTSRSVYPQQNITSKNPVATSGPSVKVPKAQDAKPQTTKIKPREDKPPVGSTGQSPYPKQQITSKDPTKIQKPQGQNAAAQKAADRNAKRINDRNEKALRNRETKQGKRPQSKFGAALAAAAAGGAALLGAGGAGGENPAGVSHKFVKKADVGNAWALQKKDLPDTQKMRLQQANRRALETTNESVLSTIKDMVDNDIQEQTLVINEQEININNTVAKKIVLVYESVNKDNKKKMENMLNESAASFNKVLTFALRQ